MSRRIKPGRTDKRQRKLELRERQKTTDVIIDAAAWFTCSTEVASDFAYQCSSRCEGIEGDLAFNRVAHDIWRDSPGHGQQIAVALAAFIVERERHMQALAELGQRLSALIEQGLQHEHLEPVQKYQELIRSRIFPEHPPLS